MSKREVNELRAEITEWRRIFRRIFPSGDRKSPDALWQQIRRLSEYAQWLDDLSDPTPAQPTAVSATVNADQETSTGGRGGKSADQPLFPGIRLADRRGDRNLYHQGREYSRQLGRLTKSLEQMIDQSADWIRGLNHDPKPLPSKKRPRCDTCGEVMATMWRYCPYCKRPRSPD